MEKMTTQKAEKEELVTIWVLDGAGRPAKVACNKEAYVLDVACKDGIFTVNGNNYNSSGRLQIHRSNNEPAVVFPDGKKMWLVNGKLHRLDGPAIQFPEGHDAINEFWVNGEAVLVTKPCRIQVRVKFTDTDELGTFHFFSEESYQASCSKGQDGRWKVTVEDQEAWIHCEDDVAVQYEDGRYVCCVDGNQVGRDFLKDLQQKKREENWQAIIRQEDGTSIYVDSIEDLWTKYLVIEDHNQKIRIRQTGELLHNTEEPAIFYRDGTQQFVVDGLQTDSLSLPVYEGKEEVESDSGGLMMPLAFLALAGLSGLVKPKKKAAVKKSAPIRAVKAKEIEELVTSR